MSECDEYGAVLLCSLWLALPALLLWVLLPLALRAVGVGRRTGRGWCRA